MRVLIYGAGVIGSLYAALLLPSTIVAVILGFVFRSEFGDKFMYLHSMKAPDEMRNLHNRFYEGIPENGNYRL